MGKTQIDLFVQPPPRFELGWQAKKKKEKNCLKPLGQAFIGKTSFFVFLFWWLNFLVFVHIQTFLYSTFILVSAIYSIVLNLLQFFFSLRTAPSITQITAKSTKMVCRGKCLLQLHFSIFMLRAFKKNPCYEGENPFDFLLNGVNLRCLYFWRWRPW